MNLNNDSRRDFLKLSALSATFLGLPYLATSCNKKKDTEALLHKLSTTPKQKGEHVHELQVEPISQVRVGLIGVGNRGFSHLKQLKGLFPKALVCAICDSHKPNLERAKNLFDQDQHQPQLYGDSKEAWRQMVLQDDLDLIVISTPWNDHVPMCVAAMEAGKHVAVEVPAAMTLEQCWQLVDTAEQTQKHCIMLENVCYGNEELWVLNMVQQGVFGMLTHAEAAYIHDLKSLLFSKDYYVDQWRIDHHRKQDGNLYPTHGLGPVAQYLDIGRGDRFDVLVSMSSQPASLGEHSKTIEADNPLHGLNDFMHGDMNSSLIKTKQGRTILLQHDVVTPRPYSRINALGGTKAYHEGYPSRLSMQSHHHGHRWLDEESYKEMRQKYNHPIWHKLKKEIEIFGGHGGMDFVMLYRLIDCLNQGSPLDMTVYDAADWSVIVPLTKLSTEMGGYPLPFPDFSRGGWSEKRPLGIMIDFEG